MTRSFLPVLVLVVGTLTSIEAERMFINGGNSMGGRMQGYRMKRIDQMGDFPQMGGSHAELDSALADRPVRNGMHRPEGRMFNTGLMSLLGKILKPSQMFKLLGAMTPKAWDIMGGIFEDISIGELMQIFQGKFTRPLLVKFGTMLENIPWTTVFSPQVLTPKLLRVIGSILDDLSFEDILMPLMQLG